MRAAAGLALLLTACSPSESGAPAAQGDTLIDCAVGGAADFAHECSLERSRQDGTPMLIVRHPDGGFRRFKIIDEGHSLTAADGCQMKGDLIRAAYLFRCFIPIPARGRKRKMNISKPMGRHPTLMRSYRNNRMV